MKILVPILAILAIASILLLESKEKAGNEFFCVNPDIQDQSGCETLDHKWVTEGSYCKTRDNEQECTQKGYVWTQYSKVNNDQEPQADLSENYVDTNNVPSKSQILEMLSRKFITERYIERQEIDPTDTTELKVKLTQLITDVETQASGYQKQIDQLADKLGVKKSELEAKVAELATQMAMTKTADDQLKTEVAWSQLLDTAAKELQSANKGLKIIAEDQKDALEDVARAASAGLEKSVEYEAPVLAASAAYTGLSRDSIERYQSGTYVPQGV